MLPGKVGRLGRAAAFAALPWKLDRAVTGITELLILPPDSLAKPVVVLSIAVLV